MTNRIRRAAGMGLLTVLTLVACSSAPRLAMQPRTPIDLQGSWQLDPGHSDDVVMLLQQDLPRYAPDSRSDASSPPDEPSLAGMPGGRPGRDGGERMPRWQMDEERDKRDALIAMLTPPAQLRITQTPREVRVASLPGGGGRTFDPSQPSTLFTTFATLRIVSGWEAQDFVVYAGAEDRKLEILERFHLADEGRRLVRTIEIDAPKLVRRPYRVEYLRTEGNPGP